MVDFSECNYSTRHGRYGGQAGDKDGIIYQGENWIVKYPKSTKDMFGNGLAPYTLTPLSEYIGSHIYTILGYDTHQTLLGERNGQIVVACKDFQERLGDLAEVRMLKNAANKELRESTGEDLPLSATGDNVNLEELMLHLKVNPFLSAPEVSQRFWESIIIDILIDNNDRNNGNWGLLYDQQTESYTLAPVYDNGNAFFSKASEERINEYLNNPNFETLAVGGRTIYTYQKHLLSAKKILTLEIPALKAAINTVIPNIHKHFSEIEEMIEDIPNEYHGMNVCSEPRKELYIKSMKIRMEKILLPIYEKNMEKEATIEEESDMDIEQ